MKAIVDLWSSAYVRLSACTELEECDVSAPFEPRDGARRWRYAGELLVPHTHTHNSAASAGSGSSASGSGPSSVPNSVIHHSASISLVGAAAALALAGASNNAHSNAAGDVAGAFDVVRESGNNRGGGGGKQACLAYVSAEKKGPVGYSAWFNLQF